MVCAQMYSCMKRECMCTCTQVWCVHMKPKMDELEAELGPIDGLVNNAAGNFLCPSEDLSPNAFNSVVQIVLYGTFHCTQQLAKRWGVSSKKHSSSIIVISTHSDEAVGLWAGDG